jgi:4'-phosphopantetheinyl transferase
MILLLALRFDTRHPPDVWPPVPEPFRRDRRWQDRLAGSYGRGLLRMGLNAWGLPANVLDDVCVDDFGRPHLPDGRPDFNISHAGGYVVCALTRRGRVGIDVERIRPLEWEALAANLTAAESRSLAGTDDRLGTFFDLWTRKESVVKADGRGLSLPLPTVDVSNRLAFLGPRAYWLHPVDLSPGYCCHLATDHPVEGIRLIHVRPAAMDFKP